MVFLGPLWGNAEKRSVFHIVCHVFSALLLGNTERLSDIVCYGLPGLPLGGYGEAFCISHCLLWFFWTHFPYSTLFAMVSLSPLRGNADKLSVYYIISYGFSGLPLEEYGKVFLYFTLFAMVFWPPSGGIRKGVPYSSLFAMFFLGPSAGIRKGFPYSTLLAMVCLGPLWANTERLSIFHNVRNGFC